MLVVISTAVGNGIQTLIEKAIADATHSLREIWRNYIAKTHPKVFVLFFPPILSSCLRFY